MSVPPNQLQGLNREVVGQESIMKHFWATAEKLIHAGTYVDHIRKGRLNPEIPAREIELFIGSGLIRYSIQVKASVLDDGIRGINAYFYRLTFEKKTDERCIRNDDLGWIYAGPFTDSNLPWAWHEQGRV